MGIKAGSRLYKGAIWTAAHASTSSQQEDLVTTPEKARASPGRLLSPCQGQRRARNCLFPCIIYVARGPTQAREGALMTCHSEQKVGRGPRWHKRLLPGPESWKEAEISRARIL